MKQFKKVQTQLIMLLVIMGIGATTQVYSHCQLPCGIYDDATRLKLIGEHILTIEKSMKQILTFSRSQPSNNNQLVRWVQNKEQHADALSEIVTGYFMAQRVKPVAVDSPQYKKYIEQLTLLHQMLQTSMKCKQTTELLHIEELKTLLDDFSKAYQG
ncbi:MAG: superoxide dismutase [Ni] [Planctomycetota bacterium]|jgi:nickel superoxide dismutase